MKILGLSCSPKKQGNTVTLLNEALNAAKNAGADVELYSVAGKDIRPCDACLACVKTGKCHINDDMQELYGKLLQADGIIFGTPIYYYGMSGQAKIIIDRTTALRIKGLANKVGGVVVTAHSVGIIDALKDLYFYIVIRQMIPATFVAAYPKNDMKEMQKCMKAASDLGNQMVQITAKKFEYPAGISGSLIAYGTHMM